jgi:hypothetical protein
MFILSPIARLPSTACKSKPSLSATKLLCQDKNSANLMFLYSASILSQAMGKWAVSVPQAVKRNRDAQNETGPGNSCLPPIPVVYKGVND